MYRSKYRVLYTSTLNTSTCTLNVTHLVKIYKVISISFIEKIEQNKSNFDNIYSQVLIKNVSGSQM